MNILLGLRREAPEEAPGRPLGVGGDPDPHADPDLRPPSRTAADSRAIAAATTC